VEKKEVRRHFLFLLKKSKAMVGEGPHAPRDRTRGRRAVARRSALAVSVYATSFLHVFTHYGRGGGLVARARTQCRAVTSVSTPAVTSRSLLCLSLAHVRRFSVSLTCYIRTCVRGAIRYREGRPSRYGRTTPSLSRPTLASTLWGVDGAREKAEKHTIATPRPSLSDLPLPYPHLSRTLAHRRVASDPQHAPSQAPSRAPIARRQGRSARSLYGSMKAMSAFFSPLPE
jgi:hypothetical protein